MIFCLQFHDYQDDFYCCEVSRRVRPTAVTVSDLVQLLNNLQSRGGYTENSSSGSTGGGGVYPPLQSLRFGR